MYKSRSISRTNYYSKGIRIETPSEIDIQKYNLSVSVLSGQGESLSSVTADTLHTPLKKKIKKIPYTSIIRKYLVK